MSSQPDTSDAQGHPSTSILVDLLRRKDPAAALVLNDTYRQALLRFCWGYLNNLEEAEDAVQEIWVKVIQAEKVPDTFRPWLYKVARNHCLNLLRTRVRRREAHAPPLDSQMPDSLSGQLTRLANDEVRAQLAKLVQDLPDAQREVLRLRYVEGLQRPEIAEVLDIPEKLVKTRLFETLKRLREQVNGLTGS